MLTTEQIEQFRTDGYLVLPDLFTPSEVAMLGAEASRILATDRPEVVREKDGRTARTAFAAHTYNDAFARLGRHPRLIRPTMDLLDGPVYIHQFKINAKAAFDGDVWQWHQDYGTWARDDLMPEPRALNVALFPACISHTGHGLRRIRSVRSTRKRSMSVAALRSRPLTPWAGRPDATRRVALSRRQGASSRLPDALHRAARLSFPAVGTEPRRPWPV